MERVERIQWWNWPKHVIRNNFDLFRKDLVIDVIEQLEKIKKSSADYVELYVSF